MEELKAEAEYERRLRRKAESLSQALARDLTAERSRREAAERACEALASAAAAEREEMEEERRMMRVAEVIREERVRMKLAEARISMEERLREIEVGPTGGSCFTGFSPRSSSYGCIGGRMGFVPACKEKKRRQKDQLRIVLLQEKSRSKSTGSSVQQHLKTNFQ